MQTGGQHKVLEEQNKCTITLPELGVPMEQVQMVQEVLGNTIAQLLQVLGQNKGYDLQQTLCALSFLHL